MQVHSWNAEKDGLFSAAALINKLESAGYSCTLYTCTAGTYFPEHVHDVEKIDAVIQGTFRITAEGQEYLLQPGDSIIIPAGTLHTAEVVGNTSVVALDAIKRV